MKPTRPVEVVTATGERITVPPVTNVQRRKRHVIRGPFPTHARAKWEMREYVETHFDDIETGTTYQVRKTAKGFVVVARTLIKGKSDA